MNREGHEDAVFFIGPEVEHTPAYSKKTLFVVGKPRLEQIVLMAAEYKTPHVFMGANHSFSAASADPYWDTVITALLDKGLWVTLDYPVEEHSMVLKMLNPGIWQSRIFVPMLSVRIPNIETSSPNLTVKIDDIDFKATNPGVWCLHYHELMDSNRFTDWQDYGTDEVVAPMSGPVPNPVTKVPAKKVDLDSVEYIKNMEEKATPVPPYSPEPDPSLKVNVKNLSELKPIAGEAASGTDMNPQDLGLDPDRPSQLKPELEEILSKSTTTPVVADLAEAYAEGAKEDPLGKEASKKPTKKKAS